MQEKEIYILGIESSCDDTSAAVSCGRKLLSNVIAGQKVHEAYGGVVPELASRAHQANIIPVVHQALAEAKIGKGDLHAVAFTRGPGLIGSLMVGVSFAKAFAAALGLPLIEVNHMEAHVLANFWDRGEQKPPRFPLLCLTVSGGHTQIVKIVSPYDMEVIGETQDDAAGEAFDKIAKILGLPFPGGPMVDKLAATGDARRFSFPKSQMEGLHFSFSGLKTSVLYFIKRELQKDEQFVEKNINDICASVQYTIIQTLMNKLKKASEQTGIKEVAIAGGVSANSGLRNALMEKGKLLGWTVHIPPFALCTDNGGMICLAGYFKYLKGDFVGLDVAPLARYSI